MSTCEYCDGERKVETDNNGPIVDCPVCELSEPKAASTGLLQGDTWTKRPHCPHCGYDLYWEHITTFMKCKKCEEGFWVETRQVVEHKIKTAAL